MAQQTSYRAERVNELIRRELVLLLSKETKDPRLQEVVITDVKVSRDLTSAKVFFSVDESVQKTVTTLLNKASGFFRSSLSKVLDLRHTPALSFIYDTAPNTGARMDDLLSKL
ncbi:30S ribosome-binding factor RbfA [Candidatus Thioglobus sp. NP1]|uniref:30S ribosome-binding factor RbfA n=1 Tax=Candidatus Thioglobus sp. NP1 TaxID=2508687 RepID=UPI000DEDCF39|nr:30S ribosome-binding factor RbfA [Candidatus Thioglobus sp. NP1]AXE61404.1 ribosome-binding factor A [Candidatus Thioglobus sp. NP1]